MLETLLTFVPVAALLTITPGAATAMIVRNAARGGRRAAFLCTLGNSVGVLGWALLAAVGVAAVVAASAEAFAIVKLAGAAALLALGLHSLLRPRSGAATAGQPVTPPGAAVRDGLLTSVANPKLAVFYSALFPQFVPDGAPILASALAMALMVVAFDLVWYSALAYAVTRARRAFAEGPWARRVERLTGAVLVGLGVRLALERRVA